MTEWRDLTIGDVMIELFDGPHATPAPATDGPVYLGIKNITDAGLLDLTDVRHISEEEFAHWTRRVTPQANDVVFTYEATLHRYALIPDDFRGCLGRRIALIRPDLSVVRPRFLHFLMLGPAWRATVTERVISGSTVDRIPLVGFLDFPLSVPDLAAQDAVVSVLGAIEDLMVNNQRRVDVLEQMARALYREWFVHLRFPGHEDARLVDSVLGPIPDGWDAVELGSVAGTERLTVHPQREPDAHFDHYSIPAFDNGRLPSVEAGETIRSGKYAVTQPAVMVSKLNPRIPRTWFVEPSGPRAVASTEFVILHPKGERSLDWLYASVSSPKFEDRMIQLSGGTSGSHQRLRPGDLLAIPVLDPPLELIKRTTDAIQPSLAMARRLRLQAKELSSIRDLLLPKLVTGQIDVTNLDLDSVLRKTGV